MKKAIAFIRNHKNEDVVIRIFTISFLILSALAFVAVLILKNAAK